MGGQLFWISSQALISARITRQSSTYLWNTLIYWYNGIDDTRSKSELCFCYPQGCSLIQSLSDITSALCLSFAVYSQPDSTAKLEEEAGASFDSVLSGDPIEWPTHGQLQLMLNGKKWVGLYPPSFVCFGACTYYLFIPYLYQF